MMTLEEVKDNCFIDDEGHWIFRGAHVQDAARIHAPNFTRDPSGATLTVQTGRRAVYHLKTGKPIIKGWWTWSTCQVPRCINPDCIAAGTRRAYQFAMRKSGLKTSSVSRVLANRQNCNSQRKVTRAIADDILGSSDSNLVLAARHGLHKETVSRVKRGLVRVPGSLFQGLMP